MLAINRGPFAKLIEIEGVEVRVSALERAGITDTDVAREP